MRVVTFGDSVLDCGRYNEQGITPPANCSCATTMGSSRIPGAAIWRRAVRPSRRYRAVDGATVGDLRSSRAG